MLRFGPDVGPVVVVALPLFEEANRTRAFAASICRALTERSIASVLPELPGQGESLIATENLTLDSLFKGYLGVLHVLEREDRVPYAVSIRSGAIIDVVGMIPFRWHLAPSNGEELVRDLLRLRQAGGEAAVFEPSLEKPFDVAGNSISSNLLKTLQKGDIFRSDDGLPLRVVRLTSDPKTADRKIPGAPLWRRSEPGNDLALAELLAADIADWITACEG